MAAIFTDIAQAVTDLLSNPTNQATLGETFTAVRAYVPNYSVENSPQLQLFVAPGPLKMTLAEDGTRAGMQYQYTIAIGIFQQISRDTTSGQILTSDVDEAMCFVEKVLDLLEANKTITTYAMWDGVTNIPYDPEELEVHDTFQSIVLVQYKCIA